MLTLRPDEPANIEQLLCWVLKQKKLPKLENDSETKPLKLDALNTNKLLQSMDTEWDRKCARVLLGTNRTSSELEMLGIDASRVRLAALAVNKGLEEMQNAPWYW